MSWTNSLLDKIIPEIPGVILQGGEDEKKAKTIEAQVRIFLDYTFLNLYQLIEIHDTQVGRILKDLGHIELEKSLVELWTPIKQLGTKIELWRNSYVAHSKGQAINFKDFHEIDPDYSNTLKKTLLASRLASLYIAGIFTNLKADYKLALSNQQAKSAGSSVVWADFKKWWLEMNKETEKILDQTNARIKQGGYDKIQPLKYLGQ
ncbi:MAG: hypothetical protein WAN47_11180 [Nitrosotalea sp.]